MSEVDPTSASPKKVEWDWNPEDDGDEPLETMPPCTAGPDVVTFMQRSLVSGPRPAPPPPPPPPPPVEAPVQNPTFAIDTANARGSLAQAQVFHQRTGHVAPPGSWNMRQALQRQVEGKQP